MRFSESSLPLSSESHSSTFSSDSPSSSLANDEGTGTGATVVGGDGAASGSLLSRIQIITTQGHPEFTEPIVTSLVEARSQSGVIDQEAAKDCEGKLIWLSVGGYREPFRRLVVDGESRVVLSRVL